MARDRRSFVLLPICSGLQRWWRFAYPTLRVLGSPSLGPWQRKPHRAAEIHDPPPAAIRGTAAHISEMRVCLERARASTTLASIRDVGQPPSSRHRAGDAERASSGVARHAELRSPNGHLGKIATDRGRAATRSSQLRRAGRGSDRDATSAIARGCAEPFMKIIRKAMDLQGFPVLCTNVASGWTE
jgi:hypothetical protein